MEAPSDNGSEESTKAVLNERGGAELLNQLRWKNNPEKILLLGLARGSRGNDPLA